MDYLKELENTITELENNSKKMAALPDLVKGIKNFNNIYAKSMESTEKSAENLKQTEANLKKRLEELEAILKEEKESRDELLNNIRSVLTANNKEQLDAVNSITSVVNNKITVAESNLTVKTTSIESDIKSVEVKVADNINKTDKLTSDVSETKEKIDSFGTSIRNDIGEIKNKIPVIDRIQIISIVAVITGVLSCIVGFIK